MLKHNGWHGLTLEWLHPGADFIEDDPKRIDIALLVARVPLSLLRRDIERCTKPHSAEGTRGDTHECSHAKISEQRFIHSMMFRIAFIKQDIRRFDVAMDHAYLVSVIKSDTKGCEELNDLGGSGNFRRQDVLRMYSESVIPSA